MKPRIITASLIAPLVVLLPISVLAITTLLLPEVIITDYTDDAPIRSAGIILYVLVPIAYPFLAIINAIIGYGFNALKILKLKNLLLLSCFVSLGSGFALGWQSPFGLQDQLIGVAIFSLIFTLSLSLGTFVWWYIAKRHNKSPQPTAFNYV